MYDLLVSNTEPSLVFECSDERQDEGLLVEKLLCVCVSVCVSMYDLLVSNTEPSLVFQRSDERQDEGLLVEKLLCVCVCVSVCVCVCVYIYIYISVYDLLVSNTEPSLVFQRSDERQDEGLLVEKLLKLL